VSFGELLSDNGDKLNIVFPHTVISAEVMFRTTSKPRMLFQRRSQGGRTRLSPTSQWILQLLNVYDIFRSQRVTNAPSAVFMALAVPRKRNNIEKGKERAVSRVTRSLHDRSVKISSHCCTKDLIFKKYFGSEFSL